MSNPFLDDSFHPDWAQLTPDRIEADTTLAIELAEKNLATIRGLASSEVAFGNVVKALEQAQPGWTTVGARYRTLIPSVIPMNFE